MEEKTNPVEVLLERALAFTETSIQLFKLKSADKVAALFSSLASVIVLLIFLILFFVNLNIGIALLIGDLIGKIWLGFVVVSGFYAFLGLILYLFRDRWIKAPVYQSIIRQLLQEKESDNNHLTD